jgi:hypothetical protein
MLSAMERFAAEAMTRATNINKPVHQEMLEQIHQRATAGDYASLQKLTNTYRDHYKKQDRLQLANDLFRINLAARREDSETIFDILNNIRKISKRCRICDKICEQSMGAANAFFNR